MTFSKEAITPWLSTFGERVQQQTVTPGRSLDLGATRTPAQTLSQPDAPPLTWRLHTTESATQ